MSGSDGVGGKAVALGINCTATAQNDATVTNAVGAALAGNDIILSEDGNDVLAGDALASGLGGTATADNIAAVVGSGAGDINFLAPPVPGLPSDLQIPPLIRIGLGDLVNSSVPLAAPHLTLARLGCARHLPAVTPPTHPYCAPP